MHSSIQRNGKNHADDVREIAKTIGGQVTGMSWWTDREVFDEYDPPYCKGCESSSCDNCEYEDGEKE